MPRMLKWPSRSTKEIQALPISSVTKSKMSGFRCNHAKLLIYQFAVSSKKSEGKCKSHRRGVLELLELVSKLLSKRRQATISDLMELLRGFSLLLQGLSWWWTI